MSYKNFRSYLHTVIQWASIFLKVLSFLNEVLPEDMPISESS